VEEAAARALGRIRSESAVASIAERLRAGERRALRALAFVRDEAPSLPSVVSSQGKIYAWLNNTWRRLTENPMPAVWRFIIAAIAGGLALGSYVYSQLPSQGIFYAERVGRSLSTGATAGIFVGLMVVLSYELPSRLRGFWPWWARLLLSALIAFVTGRLVWMTFTEYFLYFAVDTWQNFALAGLGAALAFALPATFRIRGWAAVLLAAVGIYVPLWLSPMLREGNDSNALLYVRPDQSIHTYAIPIAILIAVGAFLPELIKDVRDLLRGIRKRGHDG
jgi:hypothetical protein